VPEPATPAVAVAAVAAGVRAYAGFRPSRHTVAPACNRWRQPIRRLQDPSRSGRHGSGPTACAGPRTGQWHAARWTRARAHGRQRACPSARSCTAPAPVEPPKVR
jgi:hypothetical protein